MVAKPLNCSDCYGTFAINAQAMSTSAWCFDQFRSLFDEAELRGANSPIPHMVGTKAFRRRRTTTRYDLPGVLTGWYEPDGDLYTDPAEGFLTNIGLLKAALGFAEDAPAGVAGTVTAEWNRPGALSTLTAQIHPVMLRFGEPIKHVATAVLTIEIPLARMT